MSMSSVSFRDLSMRHDNLREVVAQGAGLIDGHYEVLQTQVLEERDRSRRIALAKVELEEKSKRDAASAMERIMELEAEVAHLRGQLGTSEERLRRELHQAHIEKLIAQRMHQDSLVHVATATGQPLDYGHLYAAYLAATDEVQRLHNLVQELESASASNLRVVTTQRDALLKDINELKVDRDILYNEREGILKENDLFRRAELRFREEKGRFEVERAEWERRRYSDKNYEELVAVRMQMDDLRTNLAALQEENNRFKTQFQTEFNTRKQLEAKLASFHGKGHVPESVLKTVDDANLEIQRLKQTLREIEREKNSEIVDLKNRLAAALLDTSHVANAYQRARSERDYLETSLRDQVSLNQSVPTPQPQVIYIESQPQQQQQPVVHHSSHGQRNVLVVHDHNPFAGSGRSQSTAPVQPSQQQQQQQQTIRVQSAAPPQPFYQSVRSQPTAAFPGPAVGLY